MGRIVEKRRKWDSDGKQFKWLNGRSVPYPDHLKENIRMTYPNSTVVDQVREKYGASGHYPRDEEDALSIGIVRSNSVNFPLFYRCICSHLCGHMDIIFPYRMSMTDA